MEALVLDAERRMAKVESITNPHPLSNEILVSRGGHSVQSHRFFLHIQTLLLQQYPRWASYKVRGA